MLGLILTLVLLLAGTTADAKIPHDTVKIGVLHRLPPASADGTGTGGVVAAQLAAGDFAIRFRKTDAEILPGGNSATPQQDLDQVRTWLDKEDVAAVVASVGPAEARQLAPLLAQHHRTLLLTGDAAVPGLCHGSALRWGAGPAARARAAVQALTRQGMRRWYLVASQDPTGLAERHALRQAIEQAGDRLVGEALLTTIAHGLNRQLQKITQAQPQVLVLAQGDGDLADALRMIAQAGLRTQMTLAAPFASLGDIDKAGVAVAQGLVTVTPFYWGSGRDSRDFARRWGQQMAGHQVTPDAAEIYTATLQFLLAARQADDIDSRKVLPVLRAGGLQTLLGQVTLREDGRAAYGLHVYRVKPPAAVRQRWDYYQKIASVPAAQAFPPQACGKP